MLKFFDCNCVIGKRSIRRSGESNAEEFYTLQSLLSEMDYAGIDEALVYHSLAKEYSPTVGNKKLMEEIKNNDRLHPCWVVMPSSTGEMPESESLISEMLDNGVRAVRLFPTDHSYSLADWSCGELFGELENHKILTLIEIDQIGWDGLNSLCTRHPNLPIVILNLNYRINRYLYPLMDKFPNLNIEISGYQMHRGVDAICSRFGAGRLIFGSRMPFFTPGPAMAMVEYALISQKEKSLIASGSLQRLLGIELKAETKSPENKNINVFSLPLKGELIIDAHTHMGPYYNFHIPYNDSDGMVEVMDRMGVSLACTSPHIGITPDFVMGNDIAYEAMQKHTGRFFGYITINPNYPEDIMPELERCYKMGMRGIKLHPSLHGYPADGANFKQMWEFASEKKLPVLSHTWAGDRTCSPTIMGKLADEYPSVPILLGHSGGTMDGFRESIEAAKNRENIFLETCCSAIFHGITEMLVNGVGANKIVFGSDMPFVNANAQIGKILYARISDEDKLKILGLNMAKILRQSKENGNVY